MRFRGGVCFLVAAAMVLLSGAIPAYRSTACAQANTADLAVNVLDQSGAAIAGATVQVKNLATGETRKQTSGPTGIARFTGLAPGRYDVTVEQQGFKKLTKTALEVNIGRQVYDAPMVIATAAEKVVVTETTSTVQIEAGSGATATTVGPKRIEELPINGRNYINFTLTNSMVQRDSAPSIGAAPTSGLNFGGQRARSNQVSVDGADATDNSVNGVRATVSQEAVQEFELIVNNYLPEFGRATGGVVNIVTKGGGNDVHGNIFGFFRHKSIQARNPFSVQIDPVTNQPVAVKQGYTRFQGGATIGGPIKKDKTFYFFSFEATDRQESGFTNIGANNFDFVTYNHAGLPPNLLLTQPQINYVNSILNNPGSSPVQIATAQAYALFGSASSELALNNAIDPILAGAIGIPPSFCGAGQPQHVFPLPVSGIPQCTPTAYKALDGLRGNYPISEHTYFYSGKLDHQWNENNKSFVRVNVAPSKVTGIQVNAQNQNFGQNAGTRTSLNQTRDVAVVAEHRNWLTTNHPNEFRFQFARRGLHYGFAEFAGGADAGVNITGYAFFGREPFSTVDRIERRWQWTDNLSWIKGRHEFKAGVDFNLIQLRSKKAQIFELNFGGVYNFGSLSSGPILSPIVSALVGAPVTVSGTPDFTPVQAYGYGLPQVFIQGIGNSDVPFDNKTFAGYFQDSFHIHRRFTLNYGIRYDVEFTPTFSSSTPLNAAAEKSLGIVLGIPQDKNNWSPRIGFAWDPWGDHKTVLRGGYGIFFDHPLLAVAFNSVTADGARSTQLLSGGGSPSRTAVSPATAASVLNAASIFQGVLNAPANFGYLPNEQRFDPKLSNSIFVNQNFLNPATATPIPLLPFTLHVAGNFRYAYAQQANFTVERDLGHEMKFSIGYNYTHGVKLNRPRNITPSDPGRLWRNWRNAFAVNLPSGTAPSSPITVSAPTTPIAAVAPGPGVPGFCAYTPIVPGVLGQLSSCPAAGPNTGLDGQFLSTPAIFNFFRPTGPNPSFAVLFPGGYGTPSTVGSEVFFAGLASYPTGVSGVPVAFSDVMQQESSGNSVYHGMTVSFSKRMVRHVEFLTSWTWSHAIDDSTDLQTLLAPQNNLRPDLERSNSTFDQRHRWVTSAILESPYTMKDSGFWRKLAADWTFSPIMEWSSGRPFTVLTGSDFNLDFGSNTDRPSTAVTGGVASPFLPQANTFVPPTVCPNDPLTGLATNTASLYGGLPLPTFFGCTGNLGRNRFTRPEFFSWDLRLARKFHINERWNLDFITDIFNTTNKFNVADVNPLCNPLATCTAGQPTAALDPRQFQFGLKLNW